MLVSIGATEDTAWRRSAGAGSDGLIVGSGPYPLISVQACVHWE
jgi:hypothetical protein